MPSDFPTDIDSLHDPEVGDTLNSANHLSIELLQNDAIEKIETKIGKDSSAVAASIEYILKNTTGGHDHDGTDSKKIVTGSVVGTTDTQTLTNKTLTNPTATSQTLTDGANIAWNLDSGGVASVTLAGNRTLDNPTNMNVGTYILKITQDGTGSRTLAYGNAYLWPGGTNPVLSTAAASVDIISFYCDGTYMYGNCLKAFAV